MADGPEPASGRRSARLYLAASKRAEEIRRAARRAEPVERRVPGRSTARATLLRQVNEMTTLRRSGLAPALWPVLAPGPEQVFRWRVELSCGCRREELTYGENPPHTLRHRDPAYRRLLREGELWCPHDNRDRRGTPYRKITEHLRRETITLPGDPVEPPKDLADQPEVWRQIRHEQPHEKARWTVVLSCEHEGIQVTEPGWEPTDPRRLITVERAQELRAEFDRLDDPASQEWIEHIRRMLDARWPTPIPELDCSACLHAQGIVAFQRLGWLVPRAEPRDSQTPPPPDRDKLESRLARLEEEAAEVRRQLQGYRDDDVES